jgi:hypothetical protein
LPHALLYGGRQSRINHTQKSRQKQRDDLIPLADASFYLVLVDNAAVSQRAYKQASSEKDYLTANA